MRALPATRHRRLLEDGRLHIRAAHEVRELVRPWLPRTPPVTASKLPARGVAGISVMAGSLAARAIEPADPCIEVLGLRAAVDDAGRIGFVTQARTLAGWVDLDKRRARIEIAATRGDDAVRDVFCAMTVSAALLLNCMGKFLLHAAAFVGPDHKAWLLVGDSQSGKSSTCANLIRLGWDFLADDQVIVDTRADGRLYAEGWPRAFNLDHGFAHGAVTGVRSPVQPRDIGSGKWRRSAPLGGLIFPAISEENRTSLTTSKEAYALAQIIRQSPWLLAHERLAKMVWPQMSALARLPGYRLQLGDDVYQDPVQLSAVLQPAMSRNTSN